MRSPLLVALLVLASTLAWAPSAQAAEPFLTDEANDTSLSTGFLGQSQPFDNEQAAPADLISLDVAQTLDTIGLTLAVRSFESAMGIETRYIFTFERGNITYLVETNQFLGVRGGYASYLARIIDDERSYSWEYVSDLETTVDPATNTISIALPKVFLTDHEDRAPRRDDVLSNFRVESVGEVLFSQFVLAFRDQMPDTAAGPSLKLEGGAFSNGHLSLDSLDAFRASNGGSSTFVMNAVLRNDAPLDDDVELLVEDLPEGWDAKVPARQFLPASGEVPVTILVSVPFAHEHGGVSSFNLTAKSSLKPGTYTTLAMGIVHTPIPQPAGHHDTLHFHMPVEKADTVFIGSRGVTMNTEVEGVNDAEEAAPRRMSGGFPVSSYDWAIEMNPGLQMGLDFDLERTGVLTATFVPRTPGDLAVVAEVWLTREDGEHVLLATGTSEKQPGQANTPVEFVVPIVPTADADYVAYARGQNLALLLSLESSGASVVCCDARTSPTLRLAESNLKLPLNEYRDIVTAVESVGPRLGLTTEDPLEKKALPGSTMTYVFNVTNGGEDDTFVAEVAGSDADAGAVVPHQSFELAKGETRRVTLAVHVPFEANPEELLEVILLVRSQTNPSNMALARTFTTVTTGSDASPDEMQRLQAAQQDERDTPAPGFALVALAALGAVAFRRRR